MRNLRLAILTLAFFTFAACGGGGDDGGACSSCQYDADCDNRLSCYECALFLPCDTNKMRCAPDDETIECDGGFF